MLKRLLPIAGLMAITACQKSDLKVLIGGTAIVAPGAQPIEDSVIIIAGRTIRSVGMRRDIPIPQDSDRKDVSGKWIVAAHWGRIAPGEPADLEILDHPPQP